MGSLALASCQPSTRPATGLGIPGQSQIANPASVYCKDRGGVSQIRTDATGNQTGYCQFTDGSECEEFEFFRGTCKPGDKKKS